MEVSNCLTAGINPKAVYDFIKQLEKKIEIHNITIIKDDKIALSLSNRPYDVDRPHVVNSVTKTFMGIAIGMLYDRGLIKLEDKIVKFFPNVKINRLNDAIREVTVKDVMTMSMGHLTKSIVCDERSYAEAILNNPIQFKPGTEFHYDNMASYMLSAIFTSITKESVSKYLHEHLFKPLEINDAYFLENKEGVVLGGLGLFIPNSGLAKTGYMMVNGGLYNNKRILSEEWVNLQMRKQIDNSPFFDQNKTESRQGYGLQCWHCSNGGVRMSGLWGQMCLMLKKYNLAMAINARGSSSQPMLEIFDKTILPTLSFPVKAEDAEYQEKLDKYISEMTVKPISYNHTDRVHDYINNIEVKVSKNYYGIEAFKVSIKDDKLSLEVNKDGKTYKAEYGYQKYLKNNNNLCDMFPPHYDSISKPKNELLGYSQPNGYGSYSYENEGTIILEMLYDNEATHFNIRLHYDYAGFAGLEWEPLTCYTRYEHIVVHGRYE